MRLIFSKKAELAVILSEVTVSETNGNAVQRTPTTFAAA
jgi:hypothetical protein